MRVVVSAKYRFSKLFDKFGTVHSTATPRLLDIGLCNDGYPAVQIALALSSVRPFAACVPCPGVLWAAFLFGQALKTDVNDLPLYFVLSWFEQKASRSRCRCRCYTGRSRTSTSESSSANCSVVYGYCMSNITPESVRHHGIGVPISVVAIVFWTLL